MSRPWRIRFGGAQDHSTDCGDNRLCVLEGVYAALARRAARGRDSGLEILRERGRDVLIARACTPEGKHVIVKLWNRPGWRGALRRLTRTSSGWREYAALRRLEPQGIGTPLPLAFFRLRDPAVPYTDALVSSDLGVCSDSTEHFKQLLRLDNTSAISDFENRLIASTAGLLRAGLVDPDHRLPNFVMTPDGLPVRLDFELCRHIGNPAWHPRLVGLMVGALVESYIFAVQPDLRRVGPFAARLRAAVRPGARVRRIAARRVVETLERQRRETGVDTRLPDIWAIGE